MVFASVKAISVIQARAKSPLFHFYDRATNLFTPKVDAVQKRKEFFDLSVQKVTDRIENGSDRPDFMSEILKNQGDKAKSLTRGEIDSNAVLFLIAGSETTATLLSGVTYLLLKNPEVYNKLVAQIRGKFKKQSEITFEEVNNMEYLIACLQEALRYYPPVPTGFPRVVPKGGDTISGRFIPEGVSTSVEPYLLLCSKERLLTMTSRPPCTSPNTQQTTPPATTPRLSSTSLSAGWVTFVTKTTTALP
jgi:cytochrome P450